jgi:hypothetical protein
MAGTIVVDSIRHSDNTTTATNNLLTASAASSTYLTQASAASTYQPQSGMSSYLTTATASSTYLTQANAASTYQPLSGMSSYLTSANAASTYQTQAGMSSYLTTANASSTYQPISGMSSYAALGTASTFTAAIRGAYVTLVDSSTISIDLSLGNNFEVTLAGNRTLGAPSNVVAGQSGVIRVIQDGSGSRTLAYNAVFKFPGGTAPVLSTAADAVDLLAYHVESATRITVRFIGDVK